MRYRWIVAAAAALMLTACSTPNYTVMSANPTGTTTSTGADSWPEIGAWEAKTPAPEDVAIVVAIEDYAFLPDVPGAVQNANDWENYFRKARGMKEVYVVTNKEASIEEITRFTSQAKEQVGESGTLWFIFIGHGAAVSDGSDGALIGMDAQQTMSSIQARSLSRKQLVTNLESGPQANTVVILDTCFSGRDPEGELLATGTQPVIPVEEPPDITKETVVLSAARNDQVAGQLPGSERPAFTYLLLGAMRGWADDGDGNVSAEEAITFVSQQMRNLKGRQQTPGLDGVGGIALSSGVGEEDPGVARLMRGEVSAPAPAEGMTTASGDLINTNEGLIFAKPDDWGIGPAGAGIILTLASKYSANAIAVSKQNINEAYVGQWLSNMNESPNYIDGRTVQPFTRTEFGAHSGSYGIFEEPAFADHSDNPKMNKRHLFATHQNGALFVFELKVDDEANGTADLEFFKKFIGEVRFQ